MKEDELPEFSDEEIFRLIREIGLPVSPKFKEQVFRQVRLFEVKQISIFEAKQ